MAFYTEIFAKSAVLTAVSLAAAAARAALPAEVVSQLSAKLPAAIAPVSASGYAKIFPLVSEKSGSLDRKYAIAVDAEPLSLTAVSADGKAVQLSVRAGLRSSEWTNRWFKAEDVFGKAKWKVEPYEPQVPCLAYMPRGKGPVNLVCKIPKGTGCASLGTIEAGRAQFRLVQLRHDFEAGGAVNTFMIVLSRENPPVSSQKEYAARAKQMLEEYAFRSGRPWGTMAPSVLGNGNCFECAAMAADAATYMFDGTFGGGEEFTKASEIRSGDIVHFKTHYIFVIFRKGSQLTTIEGNMNESVRQSAKSYSISGEKFMADGQEREFTHGFHYWPQQQK